MKRNISAWKIIAVQGEQYGEREALQALLTLGSGTMRTMPTLILWWAQPGTKRFVASSTGNSRTN